MYLPATAMVTLCFGMDHALHELLPILQRRGGRVAEAELVHDQAVDLVAAQVERAFVNRVGHIAEGDDVLALDVAEHGDLAPVVLVEVRLGAADDDVGLDADLAEFGDRLLGGLGFHLAGGLDVGQQRDVDEADVLLARLRARTGAAPRGTAGLPCRRRCRRFR